MRKKSLRLTNEQITAALTEGVENEQTREEVAAKLGIAKTTLCNRISKNPSHRVLAKKLRHASEGSKDRREILQKRMREEEIPDDHPALLEFLRGIFP